MLYRYLRAAPGKLSVPIPSRVPADMNTAIFGLGDISGNYMAVASFNNSFNKPMWYSFFQLNPTTGVATNYGVSPYYGYAQVYNYATSSYTGTSINSVSASPTGMIATAWFPPGVYGGSNPTDYMRTVNPSVSVDGMMAGYGGQGNSVPAKVRFNPTGDAAYFTWQTGGLQMFSGGFTSTGLGGHFVTNKAFALTSRPQFAACWLNNTQFIAGYHTGNNYSTSISWDVYDVTTQSVVFSGATGLPTSPVQAFNNFLQTKMISVGSNRFVLTWITNTPRVMTCQLLHWNGGGSFTLLDTVTFTSSTFTNPYPSYLGGNRIMLLTNSNSGQNVLFDISANTFSPKSFTAPTQTLYYADGHQNSGKLLTLESASYVVTPTYGSNAVINTYTVP